MIDLVICSAAEGEYAEALAWYAERSVQAAERFDADFDQALEKIASDPARFPRCDERHHFYLMRHFPYQTNLSPTSGSLGCYRRRAHCTGTTLLVGAIT